MPPLQVISQPNNVPAGPLPVVSAPNNIPAALPVVNKPVVPQPASLPVVNQPAQQQTLPVTDQPANQQPTVAVQLPPIIASIQTAINRGAQPQDILNQISSQNPKIGPTIQTALSRGATPQQVLQEFIAQNSGPAPTDPAHKSLLASLWDALGKPLLHIAATPEVRVAQAISKVIKPNADVSVPDNPLIGSFEDPGLGDPNALNSKNIKKAVGEETQFVSLGVGNPAAAGAVFGAGDALAKNKGLGGIATEAGLGALGGKLTDAAISGVGKLASGIADSGSSIINSLIKPLAKDLRFGHDPAAGILESGIVAKTMPDLEKQVQAKLTEVGQQVAAHVASPEFAGNLADYSGVLKPFDDAIEEAAKGGPNNQALVTRLQNARDALVQDFHVVEGKVTPKIDVNSGEVATKDLSQLAPTKGNALKQEIGGLRKWSGNPSEDTLYNTTVAKAYRAANDLVEQSAPGTKKINNLYGNLLSAQSAIEHRIATDTRSSTFGMFDKLGIGAALLAAARGDFGSAATAIGGAIGNHVLGSTAFKTNLAKALNTLSPDVISKLTEANPEIADVLSKYGGALGAGAKYVANRAGARLGTKLTH